MPPPVAAPSSPATRALRRSTHTVTFSYLKDVIPPRCRKPRSTLFHDGQTSVSVPILAYNEAPIAIRWTDAVTRRTTSYRFALGKLWILPDQAHSDATYFLPQQINLASDRPLTKGLPFRVSQIRQVPVPREMTKLQIRDAIRNYAIIGGRWHIEAEEPVFVIFTFGLGGNHGGTSLALQTRRDMPWSFSLLQRDEAFAAASKIAKDRGDTKSIPIRLYDRVKILMPEAIRFKPTAKHYRSRR